MKQLYFAPKGSMPIVTSTGESYIVPTYGMLLEWLAALGQGEEFLADLLDKTRAKDLVRGLKAKDRSPRDHVVERPWVEWFTKQVKLQFAEGRCFHGKKTTKRTTLHHDTPCLAYTKRAMAARQAMNIKWEVLVSSWSGAPERGLAPRFDTPISGVLGPLAPSF